MIDLNKKKMYINVWFTMQNVYLTRDFTVFHEFKVKRFFLDCAAIVNKLYYYIYNFEKQNSITNYIYLINLE